MEMMDTKPTIAYTCDGNVVCPRCDGNGFLFQATIQPLDKTVIMCDECEAVWAWPIEITNISTNNFQDFTIYIQHLGYTYDDVTLTHIRYDWF